MTNNKRKAAEDEGNDGNPKRKSQSTSSSSASSSSSRSSSSPQPSSSPSSSDQPRRKPKKNRDDFTASVKKALAERVANKCSHPLCRCDTTSAPTDSSNNNVRIGQAAHICAAAPRGPRFDPNQSSGDRSHQNNGIWLCCNHAKQIDSDVTGHPADLLRYWKRTAEERTRLQLGVPDALAQTPPIELQPSDRSHVNSIVLDELRIVLQPDLELYPSKLPIIVHYHPMNGEGDMRLLPGKNPSDYITISKPDIGWEQNYSEKMMDRIRSRLAHTQSCSLATTCRLIMYLLQDANTSLTKLQLFIFHCSSPSTSPRENIDRIALFNLTSCFQSVEYMSELGKCASLDHIDAISIPDKSILDQARQRPEQGSLQDHVRAHGVHLEIRCKYPINGVRWHDQIELAEDWLKQHCRKTNEYNKTARSSNLKHDAEAWAKKLEPDKPAYVSNDAMILALLLQGYRLLKVIDRDDVWANDVWANFVLNPPS